MTYAKIRLSANSELSFQAAEPNEKRRFSGIANSGKPFGSGTFQTVVDFDGIQIKPKTAVLLEHDPHKACGVATLSVDELSGCLKAEGILMNNEHGQYIADLADNGFPWEMSIYVESKRYEELQTGGTAIVNGHEIAGQCVILRDCVVREVSFTPVGVDSNTQAVVLSDGSHFHFSKSQQGDSSMTQEEQAQFDALKTEVDALKAENAELKKEKKKEQVKAKLSAAGFKANEQGFDGVSAPMMTAILSASDADADAMIADLAVKLSVNHNPKPPLPETLTAGLENTATQPENSAVKLSASQATNAQGAKYV